MKPTGLSVNQSKKRANNSIGSQLISNYMFMNERNFIGELLKKSVHKDCKTFRQVNSFATWGIDSRSLNRKKMASKNPSIKK